MAQPGHQRLVVTAALEADAQRSAVVVVWAAGTADLAVVAVDAAVPGMVAVAGLGMVAVAGPGMVALVAWP